MLLLLLLILVLIIIFEYLLNKKEIIAPPILYLAGWIIGVFICLLNISDWGDISYITFLTIILGIISFNLGTWLSSFITYKKNEYSFNQNIIKTHYDLKISAFVIILFNIFMLYTLYTYFQYMYSNSLLGGNPGGYEHMFSYARKIMATDDYIEMDTFLNLSIRFCQAFAYIITYFIIDKLLNNDIQNPIKKTYYITPVLYLLITVMSGGRTQMMYYFVYILLIFSLKSKEKSNFRQKYNKKIIKYGIIIILLVLAIFWIIDRTVRGSLYGTSYSLWQNLSKYLGSSIYAFNKYLEAPSNMSSLDDTETLRAFINFFKKLDLFSNVKLSSKALSFISLGSNVYETTNIYTALRRYIHDYGYFGMVFIQFILGFGYQAAFNKIKYLKKFGLYSVLYSLLFYPVIFGYSEERFMNDFLSLTMLMTIVFVVFIWKICVVKTSVNKLN